MIGGFADQAEFVCRRYHYHPPPQVSVYFARDARVISPILLFLALSFFPVQLIKHNHGSSSMRAFKKIADATKGRKECLQKMKKYSSR
jgi:hypothetical protein